MSEAATPAAPETAGITLNQAALQIEGLLTGPAEAGTPEPERRRPAVEAEPEAATQPAESEAEATQDDTSAEDADAEAQPAQEQPDLIEVTLPGGETAKVTLDELRKGYSREADYTRKTMKHADEIKAFEAQKSQTLQAANHFLSTLKAELDAIVVTEEKVDWNRLQENSVEFVKWKEYFRDMKDKRAAVMREQATIAQAEAEKQRTQFLETLKTESEQLTKKLPVFADPEKGPKARAELRSYLLSNGYQAQDVDMLSDHRAVTIAWKAAQYDKLQASKPQIEKRVVALPKVQRPGAATDADSLSVQKRTALEQKLRKSGRVEDAAAYFLAGLK